MQPPKTSLAKRVPRRSHPTPPLGSRFTPNALLCRFRKALPAQVLSAWLPLASQGFYQRAFSLRIILWYFIFQRLGPDHTLSKALADALAGGADRLSPCGKPLSRQLRSVATTSLSDARQRLPLEVLLEALKHSARQIRSWVQGSQWLGWNVALLDGTTFRLRPHNDIPQEFPPHRSGKNKSPYWCLVRVVVAFCLNTGLLLNCALGPAKLSEQALAAQLLAVTWLKTLFIADRNFGVYSVVRAAQTASAQILVRLTLSRATKLAREAKLRLKAGLDAQMFWKPSSHDQCPEGLTRDAVPGRLLVLRVQRPGFRSLLLYLFTTLADIHAYPAAALAQLYGQRWQVELNLRYVKTEMDLGALECKSAEIARKEWLAGLLAYNLIRSVMVAAAARAQIPVLILSFSRARQFFQDWLLRGASRSQANLQSWERLLDHVASCRHPRRRKARPPEPRAIRYFKQDFPRLVGDRATARKKLRIANAKS